MLLALSMAAYLFESIDVGIERWVSNSLFSRLKFLNSVYAPQFALARICLISSFSDIAG